MTGKDEALTALLDATIAQINLMRDTFTDLEQVAETESGQELLQSLGIASLAAQRVRFEIDADAIDSVEAAEAVRHD
jgi:hypothetical protein